MLWHVLLGLCLLLLLLLLLLATCSLLARSGGPMLCTSVANGAQNFQLLTKVACQAGPPVRREGK